ncbi:MAG: 2-hydroxyacid dehydrogenase [bacterium]|jgi:glyoxylate reductase
MKKVLVTREIPDAGLRLLEAECEVELNLRDRNLTPEELYRAAQDKDGILCLLNDRIDGDFLAANPQLKVVSNYAVGYNNIDLKAATAQGVMVTNTPGVLSETTADLAWALLMGVARRVIEGDQVIRSGRKWEWAPTFLLGQDIHHKVLGIVGMGRIGQAVARRAQGFSMPVIYYNRTKLSFAQEKELGVEYRPFTGLLQEADYISIHVPLTEETRHMFGSREFALMKRDAYLINTARGPIVDEAALAKALQDGEIAGAGLDVYENEPEVNPAFLALPNVILLPHVGSATIATRNKMAELAAINLLAALKGQRPPHLLNPEVWQEK